MTDDIQKALRTPDEVYRTPEAVLKDADLSKEEKKKILQNWQQQAVRLQESESEGMAGGERSQLDAVNKALDSLGKAK